MFLKYLVFLFFAIGASKQNTYSAIATYENQEQAQQYVFHESIVLIFLKYCSYNNWLGFPEVIIAVLNFNAIRIKLAKDTSIRSNWSALFFENNDNYKCKTQIFLSQT